MLSNLGKSLSRAEMKNVKGGLIDTGSPWCAPNGKNPTDYAIGCCSGLCCSDFGSPPICYSIDEGKPYQDIPF